MGYRTNCQKQENLELIRCIENLCEIWTRRTISPIKRFDFLFKLTNDYKVQTEALSIISSIYKKIVENSRTRLNLDQKGDDGDYNSDTVLLDWLIEQSDIGCYDINVEDEVNTIIFAVRLAIYSTIFRKAKLLYCGGDQPQKSNLIIKGKYAEKKIQLYLLHITCTNLSP